MRTSLEVLIISIDVLISTSGTTNSVLKTVSQSEKRGNSVVALSIYPFLIRSLSITYNTVFLTYGIEDESETSESNKRTSNFL